MRRLEWLAVVVLAFIAAVLYAGTAVEDLGVTKGEPIETGFLFVDGKYIDAPYVVERRGVDIYVNDVLVQRGREYPPYDYRVETDPGDPPADIPPFGPIPKGVDGRGRDTYWSKKARYLVQHYDETTACEMLIAVYRKSPFIKEVTVSPDAPDVLILVDQEGNSHNMFFTTWSKLGKPPRTQEEILKEAEDSRLLWESRLKGATNTTFIKSGGGLVGLAGENAVGVINALLTTKTKDERLEGFESVLNSKTSAKWLQDMVGGFQANPQLAQRYQAAWAAWEAKKAEKEALEAAKSKALREAWEARQSQKQTQ